MTCIKEVTVDWDSWPIISPIVTPHCSSWSKEPASDEEGSRSRCGLWGRVLAEKKVKDEGEFDYYGREGSRRHRVEILEGREAVSGHTRERNVQSSREWKCWIQITGRLLFWVVPLTNRDVRQAQLSSGSRGGQVHCTCPQSQPGLHRFFLRRGLLQAISMQPCALYIH